MPSVLEPGFIARIFDENIYITGAVHAEENIPEENIEKTPEVQPEPATTLKTLPKITSKTKKKFIVLLDKKSLTEEENIFISKLIGAVKLTSDEVALLPKADFNEDLYEFGYLLQFGGSQKEKYKVHQEKGHSMLLADGVANMINSLESKKLLWSSLQKMFGITR